MGPQFPSRRQPDARTAIQAAHPSPTRWPSAVSVEPVGERRTTPVRRHDRSGTPLDRGVRETHCAQERAQRVHRGFKVGPGKLRDQHESGGRRTRRTSGTVDVPAGNEPEPRPSLRIVYRVELPEFDIDGVQFTSDSGAVRSGLCPSDQRRFPGAALPQGDDPGVNVDGGYRTRCLHALGVGPLAAFLVPRRDGRSVLDTGPRHGEHAQPSQRDVAPDRASNRAVLWSAPRSRARPYSARTEFPPKRNT